MTAPPTDDAIAPLSEVKRSFAWGQLFAGSIIGGLAVWKLLHKMTNTEPSAWFAGLSTAYQEWRDWFMTPLSWIDIALGDADRNALVAVLVMVGAVARVVSWLPSPVPNGFLFLFAVLFPTLVEYWVVGDKMSFLGISPFLCALTYNLLLITVVGTFIFKRATDPLVRRSASLISLNVLLTTLCGIAAFLLNWATS